MKPLHKLTIWAIYCSQFTDSIQDYFHLWSNVVGKINTENLSIKEIGSYAALAPHYITPRYERTDHIKTELSGKLDTLFINLKPINNKIKDWIRNNNSVTATCMRTTKNQIFEFSDSFAQIENDVKSKLNKSNTEEIESRMCDIASIIMEMKTNIKYVHVEGWCASSL